ncbi:uncharacterized protein L201_001808 [Kwoniella dendrophila CBS 6074]|uniref:Decapping nuclease n=1 Tax=Kwoniella dendrophila CBS 6074 TaxID=1295534 RepID=A0AAX4JPW9_9TREE
MDADVRFRRRDIDKKHRYINKEDNPIVLPKPDDVVPELRDNLIDKIGIIDINDIQPIEDGSFTNVKAVGGYNWIKAEPPTIAVPGSPRIWSGGLGNARKLPGDDTNLNHFQHAYMNGTILQPLGISPLEPIFHSLTDPRDLLNVNLITDRNALRKLYRLFTPATIYTQNKAWRIDGEIVGDTVLFTRWESSKDMKPRRPEFSWSHQYDLVATDNPVPNSIQSERLVKYKFAGLVMIVRYEIDAALPPSSTSTKTISSKNKTLSPQETITTPHFDPESGLNISKTPETRYPKQSELIEMKTRTIKRDIDFEDAYGQMVFSQISNLYYSRHDQGDFKWPTQKFEMGKGKFKSLAKSAEEPIKKVGKLLNEMIKLIRHHKDKGKISFVWSGEYAKDLLLGRFPSEKELRLEDEFETEVNVKLDSLSIKSSTILDDKKNFPVVPILVNKRFAKEDGDEEEDNFWSD